MKIARVREKKREKDFELKREKEIERNKCRQKNVKEYSTQLHKSQQPNMTQQKGERKPKKKSKKCRGGKGENREQAKKEIKNVILPQRTSQSQH